MENIELDLLKAKKMLNNSFTIKSRFETIYPFTNENIKDAFTNFDFNNKTCLTVLGSSDQALDMCLRGSSKITAFDCNRFTKYYFDLKKAALLANISFQDYLHFFCYKGHDKFNLYFQSKLFSKIIPYLNGDSFLFWTFLFENYHPSILRKPNRLFSEEELSYPVLKQTISYFNSFSYAKLREKIVSLEFNFINCDIKNLSLYLDTEYDIMYFSNIMQYAEVMYQSSKKRVNSLDEQFRKLSIYKKMLLELSTYLRDDGQMIMSYLYDLTESSDSIAVYNKTIRDKVFEPKDYAYYKFPAIEGIEDQTLYQDYENNLEDGLLVYTKKRFSDPHL